MEYWGHSSVGRAPALQAGGHRFDPVCLHQDLIANQSKFKLRVACFYLRLEEKIASSLTNWKAEINKQ